MYTTHAVPTKSDHYWLLDKTYNISRYIGTIADVKRYIDMYGTSDLSTDLTVVKKTRMVKRFIDYDTERQAFITETVPVEYILRPNVIYDDSYRIFNYNTLDTLCIPDVCSSTYKPRSSNRFRYTGSKRHRRSKCHYKAIVPLREKRLTETYDLSASDISIELDESHIACDDIIIDRALHHSRINNRMKNTFRSHRESYGTPVSWKQSYKKKQWQRNHDTKYLDKHAIAYEINIDFIENEISA